MSVNKNLLNHIDNVTLENRLDTIIHDTRTRQPTQREQVRYELYYHELERRGQIKHMEQYKQNLSELRYRVEKHGYSTNPTPNNGL
jgi:hypothetical protein